MVKMKLSLAVLGRLVQDYQFTPTDMKFGRSTKTDGHFTCGIGGMATNSGRQASRLGTRVTGVVLTGPYTEQEQSRQLEKYLREVYQLPVLGAAQRAFHIGEQCFTERSSARIDKIPAEYEHIYRTSNCTLVAPLTAEDAPLIRSVLDLAPRSILGLSTDQLRDPESSLDLMERATITVGTHDELQMISHEADPLESIMFFRERHVGKIVLTLGSDGLLAWDGSDYIRLPAFDVAARQTIGAGDVLTGTLAAALVAGQSMDSALRLGLAASADHVEALKPARSIAELNQRIRRRRPTAIRSLKEAKSGKNQIVRAVAASAIATSLATLAWGLS